MKTVERRHEKLRSTGGSKVGVFSSERRDFSVYATHSGNYSHKSEQKRLWSGAVHRL